MAETTGIAWTGRLNPDGTITPGATWNPWIGCHKISAGCKNCYMFRDAARYGGSPSIVRRAADSTFNNPLKWKKLKKLYPGAKVFTCSWSDWFIEEADAWRNEAWEIIRQTPEYVYLILTKRVSNISDRLPADWGKGYSNVWLGFTGEDQGNYNSRYDILRHIPAKVKFVSIEPMLSEVDISDRHEGIDWIIAGGESDRNNARPMQAKWPYLLMEQCREYGIKFFLKQTGTWYAENTGSRTWKGDDISEWPESLRVQEFPDVDNADKENSSRI